MKSIDMKEIINGNNSVIMKYMPNLGKDLLLSFINRIIHTDEINKFIEVHSDKFSFEFIDELFGYLNFSYNTPSLDKQNIPSEGKLIIVANHPLGALDGLALLKLISEVRKDVKIVANDLLMNIENLQDLFLPYNIFNYNAQKSNIENIEKALNNDSAVIFFPAAEVSRLTPKGIRDGKWTKGALKFAKKFNTPILPVYIQAKNSIGFYSSSMINKKMSMLLLPNEVFNKREKSINIRIGNLIPASSLSSGINDDKTQIKLLKKHTYKFHKKNTEIFKTEKTIIHPIDTKLIKQELMLSKLLGISKDDKKIYLCDYSIAKDVIKEIARLREITFRKVGEGTGEKFDFDKYDKYYKHIVVWDEKNLEMVGAYRVGIGTDIIKQFGTSGFYNADEFVFSYPHQNIFEQSLEMGRSFIQQKYWRSNALDLLWQGIGSLLSDYPEIKYMFGAVSISNSYSEDAKSMIVYYYNKWYGDDSAILKAKNRFNISKNKLNEMSELFSADNAFNDFKILKTNLKNMGYSVPVMFKRYTELCDEGGVKFVDFNLDKNFSNCIDGMIILEIDKIKTSSKERYCFNKSIIETSEMYVDESGNISEPKAELV